MTKLDQYVANAEHCRELLRGARDTRQRADIQIMIETWEMLAEARRIAHNLASKTATSGGETSCQAASIRYFW